MPTSKRVERAYTSEDYWSLPDGERAELINGTLYAMTPPGRSHQKVVGGMYRAFADHIDANGGPCEVYVAPFAVNLTANDDNWVEPDMLVVCDPAKLSERGCEDAPDFIAEVVSPSNRAHDYLVKAVLYQEAGVREYWVVDPDLGRTTVYRFEAAGPAPVVYPLDVPVPVQIYGGDLAICVSELL